MSDSTRRLLRFGDCTIDIAARELRHAGTAATLSPAVFDCIAYLLENRDRAVGRDELVAAVWGKTSISDSLLGKTLVKARRAIGDNGETQHIIRTVPRFGFHWVAEVEAIQADPERAGNSAPSVADQPAAAAMPRRAPWLWIAAGVLLLALGGALMLLRTAEPPLPATAGQATSEDVIAVLPVTVNGGSDDIWLRLGLMDLIANRLRAAGLPVVPSESVVRALRADMNSHDSIHALREATGVRRWVVPSARRVGGEWVMNLVLEDADGDSREVEVRASEAIALARLATDRLLGLMHKAVPDETMTGERSLLELSQRVEAAMLVNDYSSARSLIAAAPAALQANAQIQLRLAALDYRSGRSHESRQRLDALLAQVSAEENPVLRASALTILGGVALKLNQPDEAEPPLAEAVRLLDTANEPIASGHAYTGVGIGRAMQGRYDEAGKAFARARIAFELAGDTLSLARVDINEGAMASMRDRYAEALPLLQRADARFQRLDAPSELIHALGNQVEAELALLQTSSALALSERMMPLLQRLENPIERRVFLAIRARALAATGRFGETRAILADLTRALDPDAEAILQGQVRALQARLDLDIHQAGTAVVLAREAVGALTGPEYARLRAETWRVGILALRDRRETASAQAESESFLAWAARSGNDGARLLAQLSAIEAPAAEDAGAELPSYAGLLQRAQANGVPADIAAVATSWAGRLIDAGNLPAASDIAGQVARWADQDFASALLQVRLYHALGQVDAWRAALARARTLAGERPLEAALLQAPAARRAP